MATKPMASMNTRLQKRRLAISNRRARSARTNATSADAYRAAVPTDRYLRLRLNPISPRAPTTNTPNRSRAARMAGSWRSSTVRESPSSPVLSAVAMMMAPNSSAKVPNPAGPSSRLAATCSTKLLTARVTCPANAPRAWTGSRRRTLLRSADNIAGSRWRGMTSASGRSPALALTLTQAVQQVLVAVGNGLPAVDISGALLEQDSIAVHRVGSDSARCRRGWMSSAEVKNDAVPPSTSRLKLTS